MNLTPKAIIVSAITNTLRKNNIEVLHLSFDLQTEKYKVFLSSSHNENSKLDLDEDSINTIKKIFISKIGKAYKMQSDNDIKSVIIKIDTRNESFDIYIETPDGNVEQFNFFKK